MKRLAIIAALLAGIGCGEEPAEQPTWIDDVRPILIANCARCHSMPPTGGAPPSFRLDRYGDTVLPDGTVVVGAAQMAGLVAFRAGEEGDMPPDWPRPDHQRETLIRWSEQAPDIAMPRLGDRANAAPTIDLLTSLPMTADAPFELTYEIGDPDGDIVNGSLIAIALDGGAETILDAGLRSGRDTLVVDLSGLDAGIYTLAVELDDDLVITQIELDDAVEVP